MGSQAGMLMIKQLACCNKGGREKALNYILKVWLPTQKQISDDDMKKLWKGVFYCVWHADKVLVQSQLIERLSVLLPTLDIPIAIQYFSVFLLTMRREWSGIDGLRLDKFYMLIRKFLHYFFQILKKNSWDLVLVKKLMGVLLEKSLLADDKFQGSGVNYHIVSVFVEELRPFLPLRKEVLEEIFVPFISVLGKVRDKVLVIKIKSNVFDVLVKMGKKLLEVKKSGDDDVVLLGTIGLAMGFSTKFFDIGSSVDCVQGNRKVLFILHEDFLKLEKDLGSSGIRVLIPDVSVDDVEDEVPDLVPIDMEVDASSSKALKKCKKAKKTSSGDNKKEKKEKKSKKKKKKDANSDVDSGSISSGKEDENSVSENGESSTAEQGDDLVAFNESVISNLQLQFEKVAADMGLENNNVESACDLPKVAANGTNVSKKRKRAKSTDGQQTPNGKLTDQGDADGGLTAKSVKKVRFSMKNNIVWKPQTPLPPQSLRIPPSVTPRGSALKKGVPAGPIREVIPLAVKKAKQRAQTAKKAGKAIKAIKPASKNVKKLKSLST